MHVLIVYNPNAGKRKAAKHAMKLERAILRHSSNETTVTKFEVSTLDIMRKFWQDNRNNPNGFDAAIIIGGDGTIGPNIDAIIKNEVDIPLYCYGRGTANDFSSHFHTNCSPKKAARAISAAKTVQVDTLKITETDITKYAINVACGGAFTNGVTKYNKRAKRIFGKLAYVVHAFFAAFTLKSQPLSFTAGDKQFNADVLIFYILNTRNVGGLKNCAQKADPSDGVLDLVCIKRCGLFGKLSVALHVVFGRLNKCKHVMYEQGTNFFVTPLPGYAITPNFTLTDIDGNANGPYPLAVTLGPKLKIITR